MGRYDYSFMTLWELRQELNALETEISRRELGPFGMRIIVDPTLPDDELEIIQGPHRIRVTNLEKP